MAINALRDSLNTTLASIATSLASITAKTKRLEDLTPQKQLLIEAANTTALAELRSLQPEIDTLRDNIRRTELGAKSTAEQLKIELSQAIAGKLSDIRTEFESLVGNWFVVSDLDVVVQDVINYKEFSGIAESLRTSETHTRQGLGAIVAMVTRYDTAVTAWNALIA